MKIKQEITKLDELWIGHILPLWRAVLNVIFSILKFLVKMNMPFLVGPNLISLLCLFYNNFLFMSPFLAKYSLKACPRWCMDFSCKFSRTMEYFIRIWGYRMLKKFICLKVFLVVVLVFFHSPHRVAKKYTGKS